MKYCIGILCVLFFISGCNKNNQHTVKEFYEDGQLKSETPYLGRYANGTGKVYYPDGNLWKSGTFKDGKKHGKSIIYHKNGKVKIEQNYKEDQLDGKAFAFAEDGTKIEETDWVNGHTLFGRTFRKDGDTLSVRRGNKVVTYYTTKKIAVIFCVSGNDKIEGTLKFSEDGQVLKEEGSLFCLTRQDTLLLKAQNPGWLKDESNI